MKNELLPEIVDTVQFQDLSVRLYEDRGRIWITAEDIGKCLQFTKPRIGVYKIYKRQKEEIDPFSTVTKLVTVDGKIRKTRVYTEQGAYLIALFARTEKAKEVRQWLTGLPEKIREIQNRQYWTLLKYVDDISIKYEELNRKYTDLKKLIVGVSQQLTAFKDGGVLAIPGFEDYFEELAVELADNHQTIERFIHTCCILEKGQGVISRKPKVYYAYQEWCYGNYQAPLNRKIFNKAIRLKYRKGYRVLLSADVEQGDMKKPGDNIIDFRPNESDDEKGLDK